MAVPYSEAFTSLAGDVTTAISRSLIFASEWHFLPPGISEVYELVGQGCLTENILDAWYRWDQDSSTFQATCGPGDVGSLWKLFSNILDVIIKRELLESVEAAPDYEDGDDHTSFGDDIQLISTKIQRLKDYRRTRRLVQAPTTSLVEIQYGPRSSPWAGVIQSCTARTTWSRGNSNFLRNFKERVLADLTKLTGCKFYNQLDVLQIGAPEQSNLDLALRKLDNIFIYRSRSEYDHYFYSEEVENVQYILQPFVEGKNRYFRTTLLDNQHIRVNNNKSNYGNLNIAMTIRCCLFRYDAVKFIPCKMDKLPKIQLQDSTEKLRCWFDFEYRAKGDEEVDLRRFLSELEIEDIPEVGPSFAALSTRSQREFGRNQANQATKNWLDQVQQQFLPSLENAIGNDVKTSSSIVGQSTGAGNAGTSRADWDDYIEHNPFNLLPSSRHAELSASYGQNGPTPNPLAIPAYLPRPVVPVQRTLLDEDSSFLRELTFKPLSPQRAISSTLHSSNDSQNSVSRISTPDKKLQSSNEADAKKCNNPMNRKIPKSKHKADKSDSRLPLPDAAPLPKQKPKGETCPDMLPEFENLLKRAFRDMMQKLLGVRGDIAVQAEFGRIMMRNLDLKKVTKKGGLERFHEDIDLLPLLNDLTERNATTSFTKVLTVSSAECQYLIDMKSEDGSAFWPVKDACSTTYRLFFTDTRSKLQRFLIDIDGENFRTQAKTYHEWDSIYVHGTRRQWDFRISANGFPSSTLLNEKHSQLVNSISSSLFIPPGMTTPEVYFELDNALRSRYQLDELQVRRLCQYKSPSGISTLKITEVQSLLVKLHVSRERGSGIYQGNPSKEDVSPIEKLSFWYEAAIGNQQLDEQLKENGRLELGDIASWNPDSFDARPLYLPACILLKRIDAIGLANDNGLDPAPPLVEEQPSPVKPLVYW